MKNKNNKNKSEWIIYYVIITIVVVGLCWLTCNQCDTNDRKYTNKEYTSIGGITIGMDSLKAVNLIKSRMVAVIKNTNVVSVKTVGDSTGYTYHYYNEKYYITIDSGKVTRVFFHSDSLTDNEVNVIAKENRLSKHKRIIYNGKSMRKYRNLSLYGLKPMDVLQHPLSHLIGTAFVLVHLRSLTFSLPLHYHI